MIARRWFLLGFASFLLTAFGCSNGGDGGTTAPAVACSDAGAPAVNAVGMTCGGATDSATEQVAVALGGPASGATSLRGLNFDVTYDPSKLEFVPAGNPTSALFPSALVAITLFNNQQGRVVVSVQEFGGLPAVSVAPGSHVVVELSFRRVSGATFGPTPLSFENTDATTASSSIAFSSSLALAYQ